MMVGKSECGSLKWEIFGRMELVRLMEHDRIKELYGLAHFRMLNEIVEYL